MHTERHINVKNFEGIRLKRLRSGVTARNMSEKANMLIYRLTRGGRLSSHDAGQGTGGCRAMIKSLQSCPKRYLLMKLTRVAPPTGSLHRVYGLSLRYKRTRKRMNYCERRGQFSRTRIRGMRAVCAEGLHFSAFHNYHALSLPPTHCQIILHSLCHHW